jgi:hypothetical protein
MLIWQALRGQALVSPDTLTVSVFVVWAALTAGMAVWPFRTRTSRSDGDATLNWINP